MRAVLFAKTGSPDGLVLSEIPRPDPEPGEVLVRIHATSVTRGDTVLRTMPFLLARLFGQRRKQMLGHEYAGELVGVGSGVTSLAIGDRVFGTTTGLPTGAYAEYVCVPSDGMIATLPDHVSFEAAATVPIGATTALQFLRLGGIAAGKRMLVIGASGSVGSYAVQLAVHAGAHVTGVCGTRNVELVRELGADEVVDYTAQDVTALGTTWDVVLDAVGQGEKPYRSVVAPGGAVVSVRSPTKEHRGDLEAVRDLLAEGALRAVIDRTVTLEEIPDAHRYVDLGHKVGNLLVRVVGEDRPVGG